MNSRFQLLSCNIALGGDILNVVARHAQIPVTYPELLVLRYLHGETAVTDVFDVGSVERDDDAEFKRLTETYGACVKEKLFPGAGQRLPTRDERYAPRPADTIANPGPSPTAPVVVPSDVPGEIISGAVPTPAPAPPLPSPLTEATQTAELPPAVIAAATQTAAVPPTPRRPTPVAAPS